LQLISGKQEGKTLEIVAASLTNSEISTGKIMLLRDVTALDNWKKKWQKSPSFNFHRQLGRRCCP